MMKKGRHPLHFPGAVYILYDMSLNQLINSGLVSSHLYDTQQEIWLYFYAKKEGKLNIKKELVVVLHKEMATFWG